MRTFRAIAMMLLSALSVSVLSAQVEQAPPPSFGVDSEVFEAYESLLNTLSPKQRHELARLLTQELRESQAQSQPGDVRINPNDGLAYVWIPPGTFEMGCVPADAECEAREKPRANRTIGNGFWMGRSEVTVEAYERFIHLTEQLMPPPPSFDPNWEKKSHPIVNVTWDEARAYCEWAAGRLPTEAEWEYAARGSLDGMIYSWGNQLSSEYANFQGGKWEYHREPGKLVKRSLRSDAERATRYTTPAGSYPANGYGLHDMVGNAWEWVGDWYAEEYYADAPGSDPQGPPEGTERVGRGGSWFYNPRFLRLSARGRLGTGNWDDDIGFRCVREIMP